MFDGSLSDRPCWLRGADDIVEHLEKKLNIKVWRNNYRWNVYLERLLNVLVHAAQRRCCNVVRSITRT